VVSFKPKDNIVDYYQHHLKLMPSTCFVNTILLPFVSGFRNTVYEQLCRIDGRNKLDEEKICKVTVPTNDIVFSSFPKIMDNIDIVERLAKIYEEDFWDKLKSKDRENMKKISEYSREVINKLYLVLYSD
jgi:hypothetical protein